jgi:hypothetical protein
MQASNLPFEPALPCRFRLLKYAFPTAKIKSQSSSSQRLKGPKSQEFQPCPSYATRIFQTQNGATAVFFCKCEKRLKTAPKNSKTVKI